MPAGQASTCRNTTGFQLLGWIRLATAYALGRLQVCPLLDLEEHLSILNV